MWKVSGLVLLFKRQIPPFSSDLIQSLGEFWVTFTFFQSCALLHDGFWPSGSDYKESGKDSLCETWLSLATKVNQPLSYYTFLFHRIALNVVTVPNELFCPYSHWGWVHALPAPHTVRGRTPCVVSVLPSCPVKWNFIVQFLTLTSSCILLILLCPCSLRRNSHPHGPC